MKRRALGPIAFASMDDQPDRFPETNRGSDIFELRVRIIGDNCLEYCLMCSIKRSLHIVFSMIYIFKEFFEKRKLKSKCKLLEPPVSPQQNSSVSWDLLTLHIVNRIAAKKESVDASNKVIQVNMMNDRKVPIRRHNIELPMSPCSIPSQIFLEESQCSTQKNEWNSRKQFTNTTNLRYGELSHGVESNLMQYNILDNSGPLTNKLNGFPQTNAWISGKNDPLQDNLRTKLSTMWDPTCGDQEILQKHFICDGTSPRIDIIEHTALNNKENLVTHHNSLPRHSNARSV
ncbi:uncharacterized protein C12orf40 homolog [Amblyraja radiata]|uniref:uncharacterized protein C12orf40 homolog n=1 Tax=Amblyraja radiata TaxID=386614 RepID=UPI0014035AF6|nr:uncharacterized protein C12orf40 homolog [Amblyraja radiata]